MNRYRVILYAFLAFLLVLPLKAETDDDPLVTLHVLSKQVRLLKSGSIKQISIIIDTNSIIRDETSNSLLEGKTITFLVHRGYLYPHVDARLLEGQGRLTIATHSGEGTITMNLDGELRHYPLPMTIQYGNNDLRFEVRERLNRYIVDSSLAEYSGDFWKEKEGILALAHLIRARYFYEKKFPRHGAADFCDLTHCQVYRGRIESTVRFDDEWVIDYNKLRHNLFFHSRCGGRTGDPGVFSGEKSQHGPRGSGVRDWLYREGIPLCSDKDSHWERTMNRDELLRIVSPGNNAEGNVSPVLDYDRDRMKINIRSYGHTVSLPVETFRMKINRIRGWNFIRSNSFIVSETIIDGTKHFSFKGEGLGHGVGLCQHGAMALSRRGYNRYEILEHYYPDLVFKSRVANARQSPYLSYCLFDVATGKALSTGLEQGLMRRTVPPGSLFKLIVSLYLAVERPDIFNDYTYYCTGNGTNDPNLPDRCWKPKGHGAMKLRDAIPNSCNLYFASLYKLLSEKRFRVFYRNFCKSAGITSSLPEITNDRQWAELLAGLDFRLSLSIRDCMIVARYLYCGNAEDHDSSLSEMKIPYHEKMKIFQGLQDTFVRGTAVERMKRSGASCNYLPLEKAKAEKLTGQLLELWGKTATVIDGTNRPMSYGLFLGGNGTRGIIVIVRKANGNMAARWARLILSRDNDAGR